MVLHGLKSWSWCQKDSGLNGANADVLKGLDEGQ